MEQILLFFPEELRRIIRLNEIEKIEEIRIRTGKPVILKNAIQEKIIDYKITPEFILQILQKICDNSIYSYQNQICEGFLTLKGGHRVGIVGNAVMKDGKVTNLNYISGLNFRIARQIFNCSNQALPYVLNTYQNRVYNTLIVSPPGVGKTTLLRDLVRRISNGVTEMNFHGITCGVVDERGEIAAIDKGVAQNDLGMRTDVIDNIPKAIGMRMLIRSMSPKVIIADEIGSLEDVQAIEYAITSGVNGIFTAHGGSMEEVEKNPVLNRLVLGHKIEKVLLLEKNRKVCLAYDDRENKQVV